MDMFSAILYGVIQGLTEFLPISSSAHLALLPYVLKISDPGVVFDLMMHLGTALAIICYYHKWIFRLCLQLPFLIPFSSFKGHKAQNSQNSQNSQELRTPEEERDLFVLRNLAFSTFISFIWIFILKNLAFQYGRNPMFMACNLLLFGVLMLVADKWGKNVGGEEELDKGVRLGKSAMIGFFQSLAIFPGVSRSGATLTISRMMGLSRHESANFSFLLSVPVILAATASKVLEYFTKAIVEPSSVSWDGISVLVVGIVVSFLTGLATIHYFLKWIKKIGLTYFSIYRFVVAGIIYWYFSQT